MSPGDFPLLAGRTAPIVIFCKSHSGSRLLVKFLHHAGVFMGAHCSQSGDSWDILPLVRYLVIHHHPDYAAALAGKDALLAPMVAVAFSRHLQGHETGRPWGWKLCEATYVLPAIRRLSPQARFIHLIRDGRDVAFSNHTAPDDVFWRKVYFDRADIESWRGMALTGPSYRRHPHLFNAQHWLASVSLGHRMALELGPQCQELRYEDLCRQPLTTIDRLFNFLGLSSRPPVMSEIFQHSIGKFRRQPKRRLHEILPLIAPLQEELGYPSGDA